MDAGERLPPLIIVEGVGGLGWVNPDVETVGLRVLVVGGAGGHG